MDETQLINGCRKGDRLAQKELYERYSRRMMGVCLRYVNDRETARDLLQDGFVKVFTSMDSFSGTGSFEGWMKRIMINTAMEKFRKNSPLQIVEELPEIEDNEDIDEEVSIPEEVLADFVNQLPERYKMVFNLYVIEEMSHKDIAALLGINEGTSKSNLARAREILKRKVKEYLDHEQ